jgi:26S proteasome non-ATPase regulatory subunit 10
MVKLLLEANELDVNAEDSYKNTPLHIACEDGNPEIVKMLLNAGANRSMQNKDEKTPVDLAKPDLLRIFQNMTIN